MGIYRDGRLRPAPSLFDRFTCLVKILLGLVLLGFVLLILAETPSIANRLTGNTSQAPLVGLVAGHWQNDSGAICSDGLREVDLTLDIARRVADRLQRAGYRVEVLPEFSPKLDGYRAAVFLAIHADSCVEELSGFKVARVAHSAMPEREDQLVESLNIAYAEATGLALHLDTITDDMRQYHALRQIDPATPGAIIECGFMGGDRALLTEHPERAAQGIANGLLTFLRAQALPASPTP